MSGRCIENGSSRSKLSSFWCPGRHLGTPWRVPGGALEASWKVVQQATSKKGPVKLTLGSHFGPFLDPWGHLGSLMELSDLKKCHLGRVFFSDLILDSVLDPPKCAQEASRCSLSSIFTFSACLKMGQKWTPKWTLLSSKISTWLLLRALGSDFGSHFWASESRLKNGSKKNRVGGAFWWGRRPGQAGGGFGGLRTWIHDLTRLVTSSLGS